MVRLLFVDIDGTLVGKEGVPPCVWPAVEAVRERGIRLALLTGRPGRGEALGLARRLDPKGLHAFESGAVVLALAQDPHDPPATPLLVQALPQGAAKEAVRLARRLGLPLEGYTADGGFYVEGESPLLLEHQRLLGLEAEGADLLGLPSPLVRLQVLAGPQAPLGAFLEGLPPELEAHVAESPKMPGVRFVSLTQRGVSKLSAARFVAEAYGLSLAECGMVGDGENDLEVIRAVGLGIAMGNAPQSVQRAAKRVVAPVEACGLAEALRSLLG
ncbi:Haloacid dehalogenase domain protein hydrolase [Thermus sp. CCB_US3_UF1]|uniref:HAD family hydrolase n=1 Tax=Thermus sp. CCB_US3_UF1 TaxID=1111069 RepID=UPI000238927E|nr:HAD family hydrolase [Thermus sp. CCB_US3_UF1]AEV16556.1 Haloacid dehalogenase domain protein hydrolase [Thermus sp. CCB_US3_UF1]